MKMTKFGIKLVQYQRVLFWNYFKSEFKNIDVISAELSKVNKLANGFVN